MFTKTWIILEFEQKQQHPKNANKKHETNGKQHKNMTGHKQQKKLLASFVFVAFFQCVGVVFVSSSKTYYSRITYSDGQIQDSAVITVPLITLSMEYETVQSFGNCEFLLNFHFHGLQVVLLSYLHHST